MMILILFLFVFFFLLLLLLVVCSSRAVVGSRSQCKCIIGVVK